MDYLPLSNFDMAALRSRVRTLNPAIKVFEISSKIGAGIGDWVAWLNGEVDEFRRVCS
jgi:hydrogenase nickel incorporation protein HypB